MYVILFEFILQLVNFNTVHKYTFSGGINYYLV